jgi:hypothetical protein
MTDTLTKPAYAVRVGDVVRHPRADLWPDTTFRVTAITPGDNLRFRLKPVTPAGLGGTGHSFHAPDALVSVVK